MEKADRAEVEGSLRVNYSPRKREATGKSDKDSQNKVDGQ